MCCREVLVSIAKKEEIIESRREKRVFCVVEKGRSKGETGRGYGREREYVVGRFYAVKK